MKAGLILLLTISLNLTALGQTGPEKVAAAYCECSKTHDVSPYVKIFKADNKKVIRENYDGMSELSNALKRCAKTNVVLTPEEDKKVPENEISEAMKKNCPDVNYFLEQYRVIRIEMDAEQNY